MLNLEGHNQTKNISYQAKKLDAISNHYLLRDLLKEAIDLEKGEDVNKEKMIDLLLRNAITVLNESKFDRLISLEQLKKYTNQPHPKLAIQEVKSIKICNSAQLILRNKKDPTKGLLLHCGIVIEDVD